MKSKEYIINRNNKKIKTLIDENNCNHEWGKHGFGYACEKCNIYTGLNNELNSIIDLELNKET